MLNELCVSDSDSVVNKLWQLHCVSSGVVLQNVLYLHTECK